MSKKILRGAIAALCIGGIFMAGTVQAAALKERRTAVITPTAGVDTTSSPLAVQSGRASSMSNFIGEAGMLRKRPGWREIARCGTGNVYGMWRLAENKLAVHAGTGLYIVWTDEAGGWHVSDAVSGVTMPEQRVVGANMGGRLYLFGGGISLRMSQHEIMGIMTTQVEEVASLAYVPVTTDGISAIGGGNETGDRLEAVNMMTRKRINRLRGRAQEGNEKTVTYRLDGAPDLTKDFTVRVTTVVQEVDGTYTETVTELRKAIVGGGGYYLGIVEGGTLSYEHEYGLITAGGQLVLNYRTFDGEGVQNQWGVDMTPPGDYDNIEVTFTAVVPEGTFGTDLIASATVGTVFSTDNREDRLFLGGFAGAPERVYYSAEGDLTYWPDTGYITCGTSLTAVNGFSRLSDGVLAVHKAAAGQDAGVYFVSGQEVDSYDEDGLIASHVLRLYVKPGSACESILTDAASADVYGDPLVLTRTGVYAVEQTANISTAERKLVERSRNIRTMLRREALDKLAEAAAIVYDGHYWLSVPRSERVYVADAGQLFTDEAGRKSYEWYVYDGVAAVCWSVVGDRLLFGTSGGRILRMGSFWDEKPVYYDEWKTTFGPGVVSTAMDGDEPDGITPEDGYVTVPEGLECEAVEFDEPMEEGVVSGPCSLLCCAEAATENGATVFYTGQAAGDMFVEDPEETDAIFEGMTVTVDAEAGGEASTLTAGALYEVCDIDRASGCFRLRVNGAYVIDDENARVRVLRPLMGQRMLCAKDDPGDGWMRLSFADGSGAPSLTFVGGVAGQMTGRYVMQRPVVAEWYSPVTDLGTNQAEKVVTELTVSTEPVENGQVLIGYETRTTDAMYGSTGIGGLDLGGLDFTDFTLSGFASSYTKRLWVRHVNFIALRFRSELAVPCCVHDITVRYKVNRLNRGGI